MASNNRPPGYVWSDLYQRWAPPCPGRGWTYNLWSNVWVPPFRASSAAATGDSMGTAMGNGAVAGAAVDAIAAPTPGVASSSAGETDVASVMEEIDEDICDAVSTSNARAEGLLKMLSSEDAAAVRAHAVSLSVKDVTCNPMCSVSRMRASLGSNYDSWPVLVAALRINFGMSKVRRDLDEQKTGEQQTIHQERLFDQRWQDVLKQAAEFTLACTVVSREKVIDDLMSAELDFAAHLTSIWRGTCYSSPSLEVILASEVRDAMRRRSEYRKQTEPSPIRAPLSPPADVQAAWVTADSLQLTLQEYWGRVDKTSDWFRERPWDFITAAKLLESATARGFDRTWKYLDSLQRFEKIASNGIVWGWLDSRVGNVIGTRMSTLLERSPSSEALPDQVLSFVEVSSPEVGRVMPKLSSSDQVSVMMRGPVMSGTLVPMLVLRSRVHVHANPEDAARFHAVCNNAQIASLYQSLSKTDLQMEAKARCIPVSRNAWNVVSALQQTLQKSDDDFATHALVQQNVIEECVLLKVSSLLEDLCEPGASRLQVLNKMDHKNEFLFCEPATYSTQALQDIVRKLRLKTQRHARREHWQAALGSYMCQRRIWLRRVREHEHAALRPAQQYRKEGPELHEGLSRYYSGLSLSDLESEFHARGLIKPVALHDSTPGALADQFRAALCHSDRQWYELCPDTGYHGMSWHEARRLVVDMHIKRSWSQGEQLLADFVAALEKFEKRRLGLWRHVQGMAE